MTKWLILEWSAAVLGAVYLVLIAKKNKWAWVIGGISSFLYIFVFIQSTLPAQAILSVAYVFLSMYAFWSWNRESEIHLVSWQVKRHLIAILSLCLLGGIITWTRLDDLKSFAEKESFVLDVFLAIFSLFATVLGVLKEKSNWIYWLFINFAYLLLYVNAQLYATVLLYAAYFLLGIYGLREWNKKEKNA